MPSLFVRSINPGTIVADGVPSTVGHFWVEIHHEDGSVESFGFYPETPSWDAPGIVRSDDADNQLLQSGTHAGAPCRWSPTRRPKHHEAISVAPTAEQSRKTAVRFRSRHMPLPTPASSWPGNGLMAGSLHVMWTLHCSFFPLGTPMLKI